MIKKNTPFIIFCLFIFFNVSSLFAQNIRSPARDTTISGNTDSAKTRRYRLTNKNFNTVYLQNLMPSSAGQEYFEPVKTLLVANLAPNFVILNTPKLPIFFVATTRVNLRLFSAEGSPVKSPSYMPGATLYFRINKNYLRPDFFTVAYSHHSNGVEGPTLNPDGTFNTDSGKFTTNFYTLTYHAGKETDKGDVIINRYDALGVELHTALVGLGYSHALKGRYGFVRINGQWLYNLARTSTDPIDRDKKIFGNWQRLQVDFTYIADKYDDYSGFDLRKRLNVVFKYYYQFPFMQNVSLLAGAGYRGQDEYNIFFNDSYAYVTFGLAAGLSFDFRKN